MAGKEYDDFKASLLASIAPKSEEDKAIGTIIVVTSEDKREDQNDRYRRTQENISKKISELQATPASQGVDTKMRIASLNRQYEGYEKKILANLGL
jgi:hypothetical protein